MVNTLKKGLIKRGIIYKKKGLSEVIATVIIILLVLVAVGIVWGVIKNVIKNQTEQISLGKLTTNLEIEKVQVNETYAIVKVKRNIGEGNITGIKFIFYDGKNTEIIEREDSLYELQEKTYTFLFTKVNGSNLKKVSIVPVFQLKSGKKVMGDVKDELKITKLNSIINKGIMCAPNCFGRTCGIDPVCGYSCGNCSGEEVCNSVGTCVTLCEDTCNSLGYQCGTWTICELNTNCSVCPNGYACNATGKCTAICIPNCTKKNCGSDGCSGTCGNCLTEQICINNICTTVNSLTIPTTAKIIDVWASSDDGNIPRNTLDNNLITRWSSEGEGQWITYELNQTALVNNVQIAFYRGDLRIAYISVETSLDNSSWTRVFNNISSSGNTLNLENFTFSNTPAKYIRIIGNGNLDNKWNSYNEVKINNFESDLSVQNCITHSTYSCYNGDVYWYNSCGVRETMREDCTSSETCTNGECVITTYSCSGSNTRTCSITNGAGTQSATCNTTVGQWVWGTCIVTSCNNGYQINENTCVNNQGNLQTLAFPGAEGFGKYTRGAYGNQEVIPKILIVNSFSDISTGNEETGTGTLRWALTREYPRIVLFSIGGTFNLSEAIQIRNPYLSVYGQTAPEPGILIVGTGLDIRTHDVVIQHLAVRPGDNPDGPNPSGRDGIEIRRSATNVVIDHCSIEWAIDENLGTWADGEHIVNITFSNSIIAEGLANSLHVEGTHSKGVLIGTNSDSISVIKNFIAHNGDRNPLLQGATSSEVINNLIYNGLGPIMLSDYATSPTFSSIINNQVFKGYDFTRSFTVRIYTISPNSKLYISGNLDGTDDWDGVRDDNNFESSVRINSPQISSNSVILPRDEVVNYVIENVGARYWSRDEVDQRVINTFINRNGRIIDCVTGCSNSAGGWYLYTSTTHSLNIPSNPHGDTDNDGYSNLEEWAYEQGNY